MDTATRSTVTAPADRSTPVRERLTAGLAEAVARKGLAASTIADIARLAGTSKRTFYEHFADKEECFLALYHARSNELMAAVDAALSPGATPATVQLHDAARAFLTFVTEDRVLGRAHVVDVTTIGERGVAARQEVVDRHAETLLRMLDQARAAGTSVRRLTHLEAVCVVGGLNEVALRALETPEDASLEDLVESASRFMQAVVLAD
ncbi:TetR/AcrR family transcriptional regulator [Phycicoccus endophyticus]|uniref:TetR/AcrR family transcriptional regulator n=1 Tax=Phycicoccus endophyticus TaxID=1690220 RepID=UPI00140CDB1D|nr:TetR/AcrR family transcriptional regulator [Phycicoccus endophyticus]NHI20109.1 TetR/AcrR family transcriptional regulator [Phycicoccus endophyticus]GGL38343.1 TetR family transcriptional regulator [Phycicoccus endophyticus]